MIVALVSESSSFKKSAGRNSGRSDVLESFIFCGLGGTVESSSISISASEFATFALFGLDG